MPKGQYKMLACEKCEHFVSSNSLSRHRKSCDGKSGPKKPPPPAFTSDEDGNAICPVCDKRVKPLGLKSHIRAIHENNPLNKRGSWNRGKTKGTDSRIAAASEKISKANKGRKGHQLSVEQKQKLSVEAKKRGFGGVTKSRWITYNGVRLASSYEVELAKSLDEANIKWTTCKRFKYVDPFGKERTYTPDFYLPDFDVYLDPKNDFLINCINPALGFTDVEKINLVCNQNSIKVLILSKSQLTWNAISQYLQAKKF
jgi:hypothetical protein